VPQAARLDQRVMVVVRKGNQGRVPLHREPGRVLRLT
jgi:hypothetical protein